MFNVLNQIVIHFDPMIQDDSRITDCIDESSSICVYQNYKERERERNQDLIREMVVYY